MAQATDMMDVAMYPGSGPVNSWMDFCLSSVWVTKVILNEAFSHWKIKIKFQILFVFCLFTSARVAPSWLTIPAENKPGN